MRTFILEIVIFTLISMLCFSVYGQGWQDEDHVWNEEKGEWEIHNKARVPAANVRKEEGWEMGKFPVYTEEWARYLPSSVRLGKRAATSWEISEAQRRLWVKQILTQRAMAKSEQRRQLIAYRKATGWYAARRAGSHDVGWPMRMHVNAVMNRGGGYYGT